MDHVYGSGLPARGSSLKHVTGGIYIPRFRNVTELGNGFIRAYLEAPGFGAGYENSAGKGHWNRRCSPNAWGRKENYVEIDHDRVDEWGIPALRIRAPRRFPLKHSIP
jgi:hypothetical protein